MAFAYRYSGPTAVNRPSWGPVSTPSPLEVSNKFDRPISGNFDRIINAFDRTNAFEYVKSTFEQANKIAQEETKCLNSFNSNEEKVQYKQDERFIGHGDFVVNRKEPPCRFSSFDRADCNLAARQTPCTEDDVADLYQERIAYSQERQLFPLQEDLADWINKSIDITYLNGDNFLSVLDNGVELCQLAAVIRDRAKEAVQRGQCHGPVPTIKGRCWQRAARRSFFSRDNMENFLTFCRELGVHENLLFESDDLVLHAQPRQVILCLLEVSRLSTRYGLEPPGLVQLEREIAAEERGEDLGISDVAWQFRESSPVSQQTESKDIVDPLHSSTDNNDGGVLEKTPADMLECGRSDGTYSRASTEDTQMQEPIRPLNELDKRVQNVTRLMQRNCNCSEGRCSKLLKVKKVGEGRYNIAGRNVFIRLLKGRHMMVRVGGGWDTLEHFLSRHDPCQVRLVSPTTNTAIHNNPTTPPITIPFDTACSISSTRTNASLSTCDEHERRAGTESSSNSSVQSDPTDEKYYNQKVNRKSSTSSIHSDVSLGTNGDIKNRNVSKGISDNSDTDSHISNLSNKNNFVEKTRKISPGNGKVFSKNAKISPNSSKPNAPASNTRKLSLATCKISPIQNSGKVSPTHGKINPLSGKTSPIRPMSANSGKISSNTPNRFSTKDSIAKSSPMRKSPPYNGKIAENTTPQDTANRKLSLTLPLRCTTVTVVSKRKTPSSPSPRKSISTTAISSFKSPTTPVSKYPGKAAFEHRQSFCGTTNLNNQAKKARSLSLASPINYKPLNLSPKRTAKSPSSDLRSAMTQANIEKGIENLSIHLNENSPNKPFLHIKAKYRSPPPREVPPR